MNIWLIFGAVLAFAIGIAHSWLGEKYIVRPLLRRDNLQHLLGSNVFTKQTIRFAWHLTTVAWWGFAFLLIIFADQEVNQLIYSALLVIEITFLISAALSLIITRGRHLSWIVFLGIALMAWVGTLR